jgi:hypothetical protein
MVSTKQIEQEKREVNNEINETEQEKRWTLFDERGFRTFVEPGEVVEVRILGARGRDSAWDGYWANGTVSGYFDGYQEFCESVELADKAKNNGIYFTLQVIDPRLIGRVRNRLRPADQTTSDNNVIAYRWLPIDIDPIRPSGISSSNTELSAALELREEVEEWVVSNMDFPKPVKAMSGNGAHLLFRLPDIPVNESSTTFMKNTLLGLADRFSNNSVDVDTSVFNPARIWKLYGTTARKGDPVPGSQHQEERPHRLAYIDNLGD